MEFFEPKPIIRLYVFEQAGCPACLMAEPELRAFHAQYPMQVVVIRVNLDGPVDWPERLALGWAPEGTPGYAAIVDGQLVKKHEGLMRRQDLEHWLRDYLR